MATHDYVISNASGAAVRADLNNALAAIVSNNSNATEPSTTYSYMLWADTGSSPPVMKLRNAANDGWVTLFQLDGEWSSIAFEDGSAAAPSIYFKDSGTDTGLFSGGTDQVNITTGGTERVEFGASEVVFNDGGANYDFRIEGDTNANLFFVDASADKVGIGTTGPGSALEIDAAAATSPFIAKINTAEAARIDSSGRLLVGTSTARDSFFSSGTSATLQIEGSGTDSFASLTRNSNDAGAPILFLAKSRGTSNTTVQNGDEIGRISFQGNDGGGFEEAALISAYVDGAPNTSGDTTDMPGRLVFSTTADGSASPTERMRIDSSGRLLVGTATALGTNTLLELYKSSGNVLGYIRSDSLANTQQAAINVYAQSKTQAYGIYKHSSITNPCGYLGLTAEDNANNFLWADNSDILRISTDANHIGTTSGTVVGTQTSDERIKNILGPVEYGLDTLKQIDPVRFSLKSEPETEKLGFIAQQVQPLVPQSVFDTGEPIEGEPEDAPTKLGMEYVALIPVLVNAIKELSAEVDGLKAQLQAQ